MNKKLRIVLAQINLTVGDLAGNLNSHITAAKYARDVVKADVIVFPELSLIGYPAEDLLLRHSFIKAAEENLAKLIEQVQGIYLVVGHPQMSKHGLYNACSVIYNGKILCEYAKQRLPNYGVFDEVRYFKTGNQPCIVDIKGIPTCVLICEDLWSDAPLAHAISLGAQLVLSPNASPYEIEKLDKRISILKKRTDHHHIPIVYVNHYCAQDELIFDGGSMVIDSDGNICQFAGCYQENLLAVDLEFDDSKSSVTKRDFTLPSIHENIYAALVTGIREYVNKHNFPHVYIGLSGGIDSALTLTLAVDALGPEKVKPILLPSRFTAERSNQDSYALCKNLNVQSQTISIEPAFSAYLQTLQPLPNENLNDLTKQNLQSRCRGTILMALANQTDGMVLSTGNRSELAVGYCTLYGDMIGGFNALKDVPKTLVYELANYRNKTQWVIPQSIIERAPSAELAPNQKDEDTLPPYPILDKILYAYLNHGMGIEDIINLGFEAQTVEQVVALIRKNEYKRRQAPPGTRINHKSFIKDWRYPLTNGFKG